jgi:rare lipoprotein A
MLRIQALAAGLVLVLMTGCASLNPFPSHIYSTPPAKRDTSRVTHDPKVKPYTVLGRTYYPLSTAAGYDEVGGASWYGDDFHGKKTANGQIYDMYGVSAAHKTLPLGTRVRVTNLENNRSVILVINDRGPFVRGRIIDLSYGAARKLGSVERGVVKVRVSSLDAGPEPKPVYATSAIRYYHVRVGAFAIRSNADRVHSQLVSSGYTEARVTTVERDGRLLHVVQAGSFVSRDKAEEVLSSLKAAFPTCYIVS